MDCTPGFHETPLSTLFGSILTPSTTEQICVPEAEGGLWNTVSDVKFLDVAKATLQGVGELAAFYATGGASIVGTIMEGVAVAEHNPDLMQASKAWDAAISAASLDFSTTDFVGDTTMGLFDDFSWESFTDFGSSLVSDVDWGGIVDVGTDVYQTYAMDVASRGPQGYGGITRPSLPAPAPGTGQGGLLGGMLRTGTAATVGRSFFNKFPNLATAIQKMRNAGQNVSRSKLYSMLKRFGPDFLISAGILTAAGVSELALAGPGHRRMNPANSKALRRATRRIKSFHRLCGDADVIKTRRRSCAKKC